MGERIKLFVLKLLPQYFRDKWPFKKFYWQKADVDYAERKAKEISELLDWD